MSELGAKLGVTIGLAAGLATATSGALTAKERYDLVSTGARTTGKVEKLVERTYEEDDSTAVSYEPLVAYTLPSGETATFVSDTSGPMGFAVGDSVDVVYDPQKPQSGRIVTFYQLWGLPIFMGVIGVGVIVSSVLVWRVLS